MNERNAILRAYLGDRDPADLVQLCDGFRSPYELSVAAECVEQTGTPPTRAGLFDAYVRQCGDGIAGTAIRVALRAMAGEMSERLCGTLPAGDAWRVIDRNLWDFVDIRIRR